MTRSDSICFPALLPAGTVPRLPDSDVVRETLCAVLSCTGRDLATAVQLSEVDFSALHQYRVELDRARSLVDLALFRLHKIQGAAHG